MSKSCFVALFIVFFALNTHAQRNDISLPKSFYTFLSRNIIKDHNKAYLREKKLSNHFLLKNNEVTIDISDSTLRKTALENILDTSSIYLVKLELNKISSLKIVTEAKIDSIKRASQKEFIQIKDSLNQFIIGDLNSNKFYLDTINKNYSNEKKASISFLEKRYKHFNDTSVSTLFLSSYFFSDCLYLKKEKKVFFSYFRYPNEVLIIATQLGKKWEILYEKVLSKPLSD